MAGEEASGRGALPHTLLFRFPVRHLLALCRLGRGATCLLLGSILGGTPFPIGRERPSRPIVNGNAPTGISAGWPSLGREGEREVEESNKEVGRKGEARPSRKEGARRLPDRLEGEEKGDPVPFPSLIPGLGPLFLCGLAP